MIAIIQYNAGNTASVQNALSRLGHASVITDQEDEIRQADKVIFPGVGEATTAMQYLKAKGLDQVLVELTQPVLGICLGMQLMCAYSEEGNTRGLGIFPTNVRLFPPEENIPHMGWNNLTQWKGKLFTNTTDADNFYFVHSYYAETCEDTVAECDYIRPFAAALQKDNFYGTQFHTEKSGTSGEQVLKNFLAL